MKKRYWTVLGLLLLTLSAMEAGGRKRPHSTMQEIAAGARIPGAARSYPPPTRRAPTAAPSLDAASMEAQELQAELDTLTEDISDSQDISWAVQ